MDENVGAGSAIYVDGGGFLEEPDAHLEAEVIGCECADGADIGGVERVVVIEEAAGMNGESGVGAALSEAEDGIVSDFIHEADAAGAHDAAFIIEANARADIDVFRLFDFHVDKA